MATNTFVELPPMPEAELLASYASIDYDLATAGMFAKHMLQQRADGLWEHTQAYTIAALVSYSRPFLTGVRFRLGEDALKIFSPDQRAQHDYFRAVRDKHVAHSVNTFEESQLVVRYWVERLAQEGIEQISCNHTRIVGLGHQELEQLVDLSNTMGAFVFDRIEEEKAKVLAIVRQMPIDEILKGKPVAILSSADPTKRRPS
jgi:hypothetical protein